MSLAILGIGWLAGGITALAILEVVLVVAAVVSVLRNEDFSGSAKALWLLAIVLFPIVGAVIYFAVRKDW